MKSLFNLKWQFAELAIDYNSIHDKEGKAILFNPDDYFKAANQQNYSSIDLPHDWMIWHVKDLYKNSIGFYKKSFELSEEEVINRHNAIRFEGVYMNSSVFVNGKTAGEW